MLFTRRIFVAAVFLLGSVGAAQADRVEDIVRTEMERQHIPGLALAIVKDGEPLRMQGFGLASLEHNVPVTVQTVFKIGSISKQFIASGILLLEDEGKLSLDDSVRKYLEDAPAEWEGITLRHLLSHTGGLIREGPGFRPFRIQPDVDVVRSAYSSPLAFKPGEKWQYSNIGYFAASEVIHRVSGQPWDEFMTDRVFRPLGMTCSRATSVTAIVPNRAGGYEWRDGSFVNAPDFIAVRPSGAFLSSLEDLVRWDSALNTDKAMKPSVRDLMWRPVPLIEGKPSGYGLGWNVGDRAGKLVVHHGGTLGGFRSYYARFPEEHLSIIVLTNLSSASPDSIVWKIASVWLPGIDQPVTAAR